MWARPFRTPAQTLISLQRLLTVINNQPLLITNSLQSGSSYPIFASGAIVHHVGDIQSMFVSHSEHHILEKDIVSQGGQARWVGNQSLGGPLEGAWLGEEGG